MNYKKIIINVGKGLVLILAFLFILTKCTSCGNDIVVEKSDNTKLYKRISEDSLKIVRLNADLIASDAKNKIADSLKVIAEVNYASAKKKLRDGFKKGICDTVEVETFIVKCDSVIEANHEVIAQRDTTIKILRETVKEQADLINASREINSNLEKDVDNLDKALNKIKRRNKIKTVLIIIADVIKDGLIIFAMK